MSTKTKIKNVRLSKNYKILEKCCKIVN